MNLRLTSRTSALARAQTEIAVELLKKIKFSISDIIYLKTQGDLKLDTPLIKEGGKGLFIKELEVLLLEDIADVGVHSLKDVPIIKNENLEICAYIENSSPFDCLVGPYQSIEELPFQAVIGTSSLRRAAQITVIRSDLQIKMLRGNVLTRIHKLKQKEFDAIILAQAGIERLNLKEDYYVMKLTEMVPAFNQGIIGLQICTNKKILKEKINLINTDAVKVRVEWERAIAKIFNATCQSAFGVYANVVCLFPLNIELTVFCYKNENQHRRLTANFRDLDEAIRMLKDYFELDTIDWSLCEKEFF